MKKPKYATVVLDVKLTHHQYSLHTANRSCFNVHPNVHLEVFFHLLTTITTDHNIVCEPENSLQEVKLRLYKMIKSLCSYYTPHHCFTAP